MFVRVTRRYRWPRVVDSCENLPGYQGYRDLSLLWQISVFCGTGRGTIKSVLLSTNHKPGSCKLSSKTAADCRTEPHLIRSFTLRLPVVALVGWPDSAPSENFRQLPQNSRTEYSEYREISIVLWKIARRCLQLKVDMAERQSGKVVGDSQLSLSLSAH